ncbi:MAG: thiamine-phosphate kinase [Gammaproteobacteria bacterium]|nr:thiamine-phosphate kinase [Gammaproteobacteria bacterium]
MPSPADVLLTQANTRGASGLTATREGQMVAISVDTLVAGVHFPPVAAPRDIGHKVLAVNLSDLAAMGAEPDWATLSFSLPEHEADWMNEFADGFLGLARRFGVRLLAVNEYEGPASFTVEVGGWVPLGQGLRRDTARPGDIVFVTGNLGDAGVALAAIDGHLSLPDAVLNPLSEQLHRPEPRVTEGRMLRALASSAIDVSDGLAADLSHILERSSVGAELDVDTLPLSPSVLRAMEREAAWHAALTSGDDYELCFTLPPNRRDALAQAWRAMSCPITEIGRIVEPAGLTCRRPDGTTLAVASGYQHFT